jgi:DNA-binding NarL/FixJ family response regulator
LLFAFREAQAGQRYLPPPLTHRIIESYASNVSPAIRKADRYDLLTDREREVLELLARGMTYAEIADNLIISPRAAETHRANLMRKLELKTQTNITIYALRRGPIDPQQS